jgi:hypothetical protein
MNATARTPRLIAALVAVVVTVSLFQSVAGMGDGTTGAAMAHTPSIAVAVLVGGAG